MFGRMFQAAVTVVVLSVPAIGQEWATKMFETNSHDFGTVARGEHHGIRVCAGEPVRRGCTYRRGPSKL